MEHVEGPVEKFSEQGEARIRCDGKRETRKGFRIPNPGRN
jgi:hypothetical protein